LVGQIFFQCAGGNPVNASRSTTASRSIVSNLDVCRPSIVAMASSCPRMVAASG
jgi:hypothetical protein